MTNYILCIFFHNKIHWELKKKKDVPWTRSLRFVTQLHFGWPMASQSFSFFFKLQIKRFQKVQHVSLPLLLHSGSIMQFILVLW